MADMAWERAAGGSSGLSAAQVEHFFERGYVCCRQVLPGSKRRRLEAALTEHRDAECARLLAAGELAEAQLFAEQPFERRIGMVAEAIEDSDVRLRLMTIMQAIGLLNINPSRLALGDLTELADALLGCIRHEELLACAESLLGADILGGAQFRKVLQLAVEPRHIEQVPSGAFRWRFLKEGLFQTGFQQGRVHSALGRPAALSIVGCAGVLLAPVVHERIAGAAIEADHRSLRW